MSVLFFFFLALAFAQKYDKTPWIDSFQLNSTCEALCCCPSFTYITNITANNEFVFTAEALDDNCNSPTFFENLDCVLYNSTAANCTKTGETDEYYLYLENDHYIFVTWESNTCDPTRLIRSWINQYPYSVSPDPINYFNATLIDKNEILFRWEEPQMGTLGGAPLYNYRIYYGTISDENSLLSYVVAPNDVTEFTLTTLELTKKIWYYFSIAVVNEGRMVSDRYAAQPIMYTEEPTNNGTPILEQFLPVFIILGSIVVFILAIFIFCTMWKWRHVEIVPEKPTTTETAEPEVHTVKPYIHRDLTYEAPEGKTKPKPPPREGDKKDVELAEVKTEKPSEEVKEEKKDEKPVEEEKKDEKPVEEKKE